ncbi:MAG: RidA family protein [Pseudomonadota bacterium]
MKARVFAAVLGGANIVAAYANAGEIEHFRPPSAAEDAPVLYSSMVRHGDTLYLAGTLGFDSETGALADGVAAQTKAAMTSIEATLARANADLGDLLNCTLYLADIEEYGAVNAAYQPFFPETAPARTTIAVAGLPLGAEIEIACIAQLKPAG